AESKIRSRVYAFRWYALSMFLFAFGLMSKPMVVTLPFVLLLLDYWPLGRWQVFEHARARSAEKGSRSGGHENRTSLQRLVILLCEKLPFFALSLISSYVTFIAQRRGGAVSTSISLGARIANALVSYVRYIGKLFWPQKLSVLYPHPGSWPAWEVATAGSVLFLIFAMVTWQIRKRPYLIVGWLWFCGTLIPVIGLIQVGVQSMADRYTYVPLVGLFIMLVWSGTDFVLARIIKPIRSSVQPPNSRETASTNLQTRAQRPFEAWNLEIPWSLELGAWSFTAMCALLLCSLLTLRQLQYWRTSESLFSHAVQVTKNNYLAYN